MEGGPQGLKREERKPEQPGKFAAFLSSFFKTANGERTLNNLLLSHLAPAVALTGQLLAKCSFCLTVKLGEKDKVTTYIAVTSSASGEPGKLRIILYL